MVNQESETECLVDHLRTEADQEALAALFSQYRGRLQRLINFRIDRRLTGRVDSSDVMQQVYVEAQSRLPHFAKNPDLSFYGWLRHITLQTLIDVHRRHLGTKKRDAKQEVSLNKQVAAQSLAEQLADSLTSPSQAAVRRETVNRLRNVIEGMDEIDREVLVLRHFEEMGNNDVAQVLGIGEAAASNRYVRALKRLRDMLDTESSES